MDQLVSVESNVVTPFLKWAGGKRWFVSGHGWIFPLQFGRYIEPFLGSGAVFFHLQPKHAILADINDELIETYSVIRDNWEKLRRKLAVHSSNHNDAYYYRVRSNKPSREIDRAARMIYLNRTCWNGLYRVNLKGEFNVPRGTKNKVLLDTDDFEGISKLLRSVKLKVSDFEQTINAAAQNDFVFADPPYTVKHNNNGFLKYNDTIFSWEDQIRLRDAVFRAHRRGALVAVTNANHPSIRNLYREFSLTTLSRVSVLAGDSEARGATEELLITNFQF